MATYNTYSDPGHGWAKVPVSKLVKYGIADKISRYSYVRGDFAYLEEDCDLTTFMKAAKEHGEEVKFRHYSGNKSSRIRNYASYTYNA